VTKCILDRNISGNVIYREFYVPTSSRYSYKDSKHLSRCLSLCL